MTVQDLHDAIGLLPEEMVAEADRYRTRKVVSLPRRRWDAAIAACLALVLVGGFAATQLMQSKGGSAADQVCLQAAPAVQGAAAGAETPQAVPEAAPTEKGPANGFAAPGGESGSRSHALPEGVEAILVVNTPALATAGTGEDTAQGILAHCVTLAQSREELDAQLLALAEVVQTEDLTQTAERWDAGWFESHDLLLVDVTVLEPSTPVVTGIDWESLEIHLALEPDEAGSSQRMQVALAIEKGRIDPTAAWKVSQDWALCGLPTAPEPEESAAP